MLIGSFYEHHVLPPDNETPSEIATNQKFFPYFRHCHGGVDCSHIDSWVLEGDAACYQNRKGSLSQNILAACDFALYFLYILSRWEGSTSDSAIFDYACQKDFRLPPGQYYLADAGFPLCDLLMTPYHGICYHLKEWGCSNQWLVYCIFHPCRDSQFLSDRPWDHQELFNLWHAQLCNVIEHIFGVANCRFHLMIVVPEYSIATQAKFILALAALPNLSGTMTLMIWHRIWGKPMKKTQCHISEAHPMQLQGQITL